jgi:hypothetical protein
VSASRNGSRRRRTAVRRQLSRQMLISTRTSQASSCGARREWIGRLGGPQEGFLDHVAGVLGGSGQPPGQPVEPLVVGVETARRPAPRRPLRRPLVGRHAAHAPAPRPTCPRRINARRRRMLVDLPRNTKAETLLFRVRVFVYFRPA